MFPQYTAMMTARNSNNAPTNVDEISRSFEKIQFCPNDLENWSQTEIKSNLYGSYPTNGNFSLISNRVPFQVYLKKNSQNGKSKSKLDTLVSETFPGKYHIFPEMKVLWEIKLSHIKGDLFFVKLHFLNLSKETAYDYRISYVLNSFKPVVLKDFEGKLKFDSVTEPAEIRLTPELLHARHSVVIIVDILMISDYFDLYLDCPQDLAYLKRFDVAADHAKFFTKEETTRNLYESIDSKKKMDRVVKQMDKLVVCRVPTKKSPIIVPAAVPENFEDFQKLFEDPVFSDLTIVVQGEKLRAHRSILATRSDIFRGMLSLDSSCKSGEIEIRDFSSSTIRELLRFMYTGQVKVTNEECAKEILEAACKYTVLSLIPICENILIEHYLDVGNAIEFLNLADFCNAEKLRLAAMNRIVEHIDQFSQDGLLVLQTKELIVQILKRVSENKLL